MNGDRFEDEIEQRLRRLDPIALSDEVLQKLAGHLERLAPPTHRRLPVRLAMAATSLAVCLVVFMLWPTTPARETRAMRLSGPERTSVDELRRLPSVLAYRVRAAVSLEELDHLLDEHARSLLLPSDRSSLEAEVRRDNLFVP
jgi:hypothetical protein